MRHFITYAPRQNWISRLILATSIIADVGATAQQLLPASTNASSSPTNLAAAGDTLFFAADDGLHGRELWLCDSAGECRLAADTRPGPEGGLPQDFIYINEQLYFTVTVKERNPQPFAWSKDANAPVPVECEDLSIPFQELRLLCQQWPTSSHLFFFGGASSGSVQLWACAAGSAQAVQISRFASGDVPGGEKCFAHLDRGPLYFGAGDSLWKAEVGAGTTEKIRDFEDTIGNVTHIMPLSITIVFAAGDSEHGRELWTSDGSAAGTHLLKDITHGPASTNFLQTYSCGATAYFSADDGAHGLELWRTDGTSDGTQLVRDISPGRPHSDPHYFSRCGSYVYFAADDGEHGSELWRTDGSARGTAMVRDINPGVLGSEPWSLVPYQGKLYFCCNSVESGEEVFRTDGTSEGTTILRDICPGNASSGPDNLTSVGGKLYFSCNDGVYGEELWVTDGTSSGTRLAADINIPRSNPSSAPRELTAFGDALYFVARDATFGTQVWKTDGTEAGTNVLHGICKDENACKPRDLRVTSSSIFFVANDSVHGEELWRTDGTDEGTTLLYDVYPGTPGSEPSHLFAHENTLYFAADDGEHGRELWVSDGSKAGTHMTHDTTPGPDGTDVLRVFSYYDTIYYYAKETSEFVSLWRLSAPDTAEDVRSDSGQSRNVVAERCYRFDTRYRYWDSADPDAVPSAPSDPAIPILCSVFPWEAKRLDTIVTVDDNFYFAFNATGVGAELWRTPGRFDHLSLVQDMFPGPASSSPTNLLSLGGIVYFIADHPREGRVIWSSDGSSTGTSVFMCRYIENLTSVPARSMTLLGDSILVCGASPVGGDIRSPDLGWITFHAAGGPAYSALVGHGVGNNPHALTSCGSRVYYTVDDGVHGEELWVIAGAPLGTHLVKDILTLSDFAERAPYAKN